MTNAIQLSAKADDGRIFVVGGENVEAFFVNLVALFDSEDDARDVYNAAKGLLAPVQAAVGNVIQSFPQAAPVQPQYQPVVPQPHQDGGYVPPPVGPVPMGKNGKPRIWRQPGINRSTGEPYAAYWALDNGFR